MGAEKGNDINYVFFLEQRGPASLDDLGKLGWAMVRKTLGAVFLDGEQTHTFMVGGW